MLSPGLYMVVVFVVMLAAASWLFLGAIMDEMPLLLRLVMIIVGVLAVIIMPNRDLYLPFLGEAAIPASILHDTQPRGNVVVALDHLPPGSKVMFWAANGIQGHSGQSMHSLHSPPDSPRHGKHEKHEEHEKKHLHYPQVAYKESVNGGIVTTNDEGIAYITLECPQQYKVNRFGIDKVLPKHVHFRFELPGKPGIFSSVQTHELADVCA